MKIVILDGYTENPGDLSWSGFQALGELTVYDRTPEDQIIERIGDAEIVITNKTPLTADTLRKCESIRYIGVLATGYNVVDVRAAGERGIPVTNIPTYGTKAVAQFAIALLLELCHHIGEHSDAVKRGDWTNSIDWCFWNHPLIELDGKTMGIIGLGKIGQSTAQIAQALGMKVLANDTYRIPELESDTLRYAELDELLAESDVVVLHCPPVPVHTGDYQQEYNREDEAGRSNHQQFPRPADCGAGFGGRAEFRQGGGRRVRRGFHRADSGG